MEVTRKQLLCGLLLILGTGLYIWAAPALAEGGDGARGKMIYEKLCLLCHGAQGKGDGPMGKALKPPPTDFTSPKSKAKSDTDWMKIIQDGLPSTTMPGYKDQLPEQQILDVLTYVRSLAQ